MHENFAEDSAQTGRIGVHFRLLERLGAGGMGVVHKAFDERLQRTVALKVLPPTTRKEATARERLLREARAAAALNHPHIATIYEVGTDTDGAFIAMEYVEGETLHARLQQQPLTVDELLNWSIQISDALSEAHNRGILHRDIKSLNVMITLRDQVKVLDFGLARSESWFRDGGQATSLIQLTEPGSIMGTVDYVAPEILRGEESSTRSDVFSLGVMFYEMATGHLPFTDRNTVLIMNAILNEEPPPATTSRPDLPPDLADVIMQALGKDPQQRHASARELLAELQAVQQKRRTVEIMATAGIARPDGPPPNNLPASITTFIGREKELDELVQLVSSHRLLTITGPGGAGKTRLSLELARQVLEEHSGGVFLVELASLSESPQVPQAVARSLNVREEPGRDVTGSLVDHLRSRQILLVLDNCEHLIEECASLVTTLLQACPELTVIATSQERLSVPGESTWQIPTLSVPDRNTVTDWGGRIPLEELMGYGAIRLFLERAMAAKSGFLLTEQNAATVMRICRRLDGIPLALELAAARVRVLSVAQIYDRLEDRFRLLTSGGRTSLPRQRTLRGAVEWSVDLLTDSEATLFRRLSVFTDGWTLEAAEQVCSCPECQDYEILDLLARLLDKSLVNVRENEEERRYYQLETLRDYGATLLAEAGEDLVMHANHATYYCRLAEAAEPELTGPDQAVWLDRLDREYSNIHAALRWQTTIGMTTDSMRLGGAIWRFWLVRGYLSEGRRLLADVLALSLPDTEEAVTLRARTLCGAGALANDQGDFNAAQQHFEECLQIRRQQGDHCGTAEILKNLGVAARDKGEYATARDLLDESLQISRHLCDDAGVAMCIHALGITAHREGDCQTARALFEEGLQIRRRLGDRRGIAALMAHLGSVAYDLGEHTKAGPMLTGGLEMFRELGNKRGIVFAAMYLAGVARQKGELDVARSHLTECLDISQQLGDKHHLARGLEWLADLAMAENRPDRTLILLGAAGAQREAIGSPLSPMEQVGVDRNRKWASEAVGEDRCQDLLSEGAALSLENALALARSQAAREA